MKFLRGKTLDWTGATRRARGHLLLDPHEIHRTTEHDAWMYRGNFVGYQKCVF